MSLKNTEPDSDPRNALASAAASTIPSATVNTACLTAAEELGREWQAYQTKANELRAKATQK